MQKQTLAFIGAGNMATSLITGLIATGYPAQQIWVSNSNLEKLQSLEQKFKVNATSDNKIAAKNADIILLCVKPQMLAVVAEEIKPFIQERNCCVISIAAGIRIANLNLWLGEDLAIIRAMPNTPAMVQAGATAIFANPTTTAEQKSWAEAIMRSVGIVVWVDQEKEIDIVTALSGSGPAYFFLFMEYLEQAAINLGLAAEKAHLLALQTALGAAKMALESDEDIRILRQKVTSKGGTTEAALNEFNKASLDKIIMQAVSAATNRAEELSR